MKTLEECQNVSECRLNSELIIGKAQPLPYTIVYFLINDGEIVYVGQSKLGLSRVYQHRDKVFDGVYYIPVKADMLDTVENYYILKFKPKYNKTLSKYGFISLYVLRKRMKENGLPAPYFHIPKIKQAIRTLDIGISVFNGLFYVSDRDGQKIIDYLFKNYGVAK